MRVGSELRLRGTVAPLGDVDAYQRRRGAHAAIDVARWSATGRARGGLAGAARRRPRAARPTALGRGLAAARGARCCAAWCSGRTRRSPSDVRGRLPAVRASRTCSRSRGQNVLLLCIARARGLARSLGVPLRARLIAAAVLVALYVPLAGGGPSIQRAGVMGDRRAGRGARRAGRRRAGTRSGSPRRSRSRSTRARPASPAGSSRSRPSPALLRARAAAARRCSRARLPAPVADAAAITVAATVATAPLLALHFEQVSLASLPANLLAAPAVAPVMWLGMLGAPPRRSRPALALPLNALCAPLLGYLEWVAHARRRRAARRGAGAARRRRPGSRGAYAALAARRRSRRGGAPPGTRGRRRAPRGRAGARSPRAAAALAVACWRRRGTPRAAAAARGRGELVVSFLDVGQGDATLIQRGAARVLVDTGPPGGPILRAAARGGRAAARPARAHPRRGRPRGRRCRCIARTGRGWCSTAAPAGRRRSSAALPGALDARRRPRASPPAPARSLRGRRARAARARGRRRARPAGGPTATRTTARSSRASRDGRFDLLLPADAESDVTAALALPHVEVLKVSHHGSADAGPARAAGAPRAAGGRDRGRRGQHLRPSGAGDAGALRAVPQVVPDRPRRHGVCALGAVRGTGARCGRRSTGAADGSRAAPAPAGRSLDSAAVPAFKPAYLIHGDDHGRIAERRARLRAMAEAESGAGGRRGVRGRRLHARGGGGRAVRDDVRASAGAS